MYHYLAIFLAFTLPLSLQAEIDPIPDDEVCIDEEIYQENTDVTEIPDQDEESFFSFLDQPQSIISDGLKSFASGMDEFFADEKVYYESTGSYLRLTLDTIWKEGVETGYISDVKLKLRLPRTQKKMKLVFESDADKRLDDVDHSTEKTPVQSMEESEYFAGIQATLGDEKKWRLKPSIGVHFGSNTELYVRFRADREYQFGGWQLHWNETPFWFDSTKWGLDTLFELDKKYGEDNLFRTSTFGRWTEVLDYFELSHTFAMYHTLSERRIVSYQASVYGISEPTVHATDYLLQLRYRQNIHKDYLFMELVPSIRYEKINNFETDYGFLFRIEMIFNG